jgi:hypothetical protein
VSAANFGVAICMLVESPVCTLYHSHDDIGAPKVEVELPGLQPLPKAKLKKKNTQVL